MMSKGVAQYQTIYDFAHFAHYLKNIIENNTHVTHRNALNTAKKEHQKQ